MKKFLNIVFVAFLITCCSNVFAQEAPKDSKPVDKAEAKVEDTDKKPRVKMFKPRMPRQAKSAVEFFKLADELQLTDDQIIQLRGYYKKHLVAPQKKLERPSLPSPDKFYKMTEEEMNKFAENESKKVHDVIMSALQKVIDIKKILSPEQLQKLKAMAHEDAEKALAKMAEAGKKAKERKNKKEKDCKDFMCGMQTNMWPGCPMMGEWHHGMQPHMGPRRRHMMDDSHGMQPQMCPRRRHMMDDSHGMQPHMGPRRRHMMGDWHGMQSQMGPRRCPMMSDWHGMQSQMGPRRCPMMSGRHGMMPEKCFGKKKGNKNCKSDFRKSPYFNDEYRDFDEKSFFKFMKKVFDWQKNKKCDTMDLGNKNPKFDSLKKDGEKLPPLHMNKPEGPKAEPKGTAEK